METSTDFTKDSAHPLFFRGCALVMAMSTVFTPSVSSALVFPGLTGRTVLPFTPSATQLPELKRLYSGSADVSSVGSTMTITQTSDRAIIDWSSFNLGSGATVNFKQPSSSSATLNRIYDNTYRPSVINGTLTANGAVYLINRNGVFFGPKGSVQVQSLVASAFNISDKDFYNGRLRFQPDDDTDKYYSSIYDTTISNEGEITTNSGGSVIFVGPKVQNLRKISAPAGKISLVGLNAGGNVEIQEVVVADARALANDVVYGDVSTAGNVANMFGGSLIGEDGGIVGLYGDTVRNDGLIRTVTTRTKDGVVILAANTLAATGAESKTEIDVSESTEAVSRLATTFTPGTVFFTGLYQLDGTESKHGALQYIDHEGIITAHSGNVNMQATEQVYLGSNSSIDVSGFTIKRSMTDQFIEVQLNSLYLRDYYIQKYGSLLGKTVTVDVLSGSAIGDLSSYYLGMVKKARDLSTTGGTITIGANSNINGITGTTDVLNNIIVNKGAKFDISGGYTLYSGSGLATSQLVTAGGQIYDISSAPAYLTYTGVLGQTIKSYGKYGSEVLYGISFGGHLMSLNSTAANLADRTVGGNAGTLTLKSRVVAGLTEGAITSNLYVGRYQTATTSYVALDSEKEDYQNYLISLNRGLEEPKGGKFVVGDTLAADLSNPNSVEEDAAVSSVVVTKTGTAVTGVLGDMLDINTVTEISADMINKAGLGTLEIYANTEIKTEEDANITLRPGGSYIARGRRIEFLGSVTTAGGSVEMTTRPNITSFSSSSLYNGTILQTIYLGSNSVISTAGEQIDYSLPTIAPDSIRTSAQTSGGSISLLNYSESGVPNAVFTSNNEGTVVVSKGALLDVSGGYLISSTGTVSGGDAGTLTIKAPTISLAGTLRGYSQAGKKGGTLALHAQDVVVAAQGRQFAAGFGINDTISDTGLLGKLVLGVDQIKDNGFTNISLTATNTVAVEAGVDLSPSLVKSAPPNKKAMAGAVCGSATCTLLSSYPTFTDLIGDTSITLTAGQNVYGIGYGVNLVAYTNNDNADTARVVIAKDASVTTTPGGTITLTAPGIGIDGTVSSSGGIIKATATNGDLTVSGDGQILAAGYNKTGISSVVDQPDPVPVPVDGGKVTLTAATSLDLEEGSFVDVSGSKPAEGFVSNSDGTLTKVTVAGNAGSLTLSYGTSLNLDGEISGGGKMTGTSNGDLTIKHSGALALNSSDIARYQLSGFDALTFLSATMITVPADLSVSVGRRLTLDSELIQGLGKSGDTATISAPWIQLLNTGSDTADSQGTVKNEDGGSISFLAKKYLDVEGSILVKGFSDVTLQAGQDLTLADHKYSAWKGELNTDASKLTLRASRIYPTTASKFDINTPGKVTIPYVSGVDYTSPVYSAGGSLTITAQEGIEQNGYLAAPMGSITLDGGNGRVELSATSVTTTAGSAAVAYGTYDGSTWYWWDKYNSSSIGTDKVTAAPSKSITLEGSEVVVRDGSVQDLSGGGSVYATYFQPGTSGTKNPLTISGRYVILPDGAGPHTAKTVYLEACPALGLKAGFYSVLDASYAFVPGALVIQTTGKQLLAGQTTLTKEHYAVVGGYLTKDDTASGRQVLTGFSVRLASDVLNEGDFTVKTFTAGDGGSFTLNATNGAYFGGTVKIDPLAGYAAGSLSFAAKNVEVVDSVTTPDFSQALGDTLQLDAGKLSDLSAGGLTVGDSDTDTVTVQKNVSLKAEKVTLAAANEVNVKEGAHVEATGSDDGDYVSVSASTGTFSMEKNAEFVAKKGIELDVSSYAIDNSAVLNSGSSGYFSLTTDMIIFNDASKSFWDKAFANNSNLKIAGRSGIDLGFSADTTLANSGLLTIDTPLFSHSKSKDVTFQSGEIKLQNSYATSSDLQTGDGSLTFKAGAISVVPRKDSDNGTGNITLSGFKTVNLDSTNDLVFKGEGKVKAAEALNLTAARITTGYDKYKKDTSGNAIYTAANIIIDARSGAVTLNGSSNGTAGATSTPGGSLTILGNTITQTGGVLDTAAGQINLTAKNDISVNGSIQAKGVGMTTSSLDDTVTYYSGGKITLQSVGGKVELGENSTLDVSAAAGGGDAGTIVLSAVTGGVDKKADATLLGTAGSGGAGGSFTIDSATLDGVGGLDGLDGLSSILSGGGFNELLNIRSRGGDLTLSSDSKTLTGREVVIAADEGSIYINGNTANATGGINADTTDGSGRIELYAGKKLNLEDGATLSARGTDAGADGGTVILSSQDNSKNQNDFSKDDKGNYIYALNVKSGSSIDVSGKDENGKRVDKGTVYFRAYQNKSYNDVNMAAVAGTITGASGVSVEAVRSYSNVTNIGEISTTTGYGKDATDFMTNAAAAKTRLTTSANSHFKAGIEISSVTGTDLAVDTAIDLNTVRPGDEAVVLTLKSGKDLLINKKITDAPTTDYTKLYSSTMLDSTAINLVAGSDGGANYMGVTKGSALTDYEGTGDLKIKSGTWVYTENAPIRFAAGNDAIFSGTSTAPTTMINNFMKYNLGSYGGSVRGDVGRDLSLPAIGSAIQTALGDITITTGRNLKLGSTGAIRTTGEYTTGLTAKQPGKAAISLADTTSYWTYHNGGDVNLNVGDSVNGILDKDNAWDVFAGATDTTLPKYLTAAYGSLSDSALVGIATMAGGDVTVKAGGALKAQVGVFGAGDLKVTTGGDMNGRFRIMGGNTSSGIAETSGTATLRSGGGLGTIDNPVVFELGNAQVTAAAMGDVQIGSVQNPDNSRSKIFPVSANQTWNMTYTEETSFSASSLRGDIVLYGTNPFSAYSSVNDWPNSRLVILPATFSLSAKGDITVENQFVLAPSTDGNLSLIAGGSIKGVDAAGTPSGFIMSDVYIDGNKEKGIAAMYGRQTDYDGLRHYEMLLGDGNTYYGINHEGDTTSVVVKAGDDISDLKLKLNKPAQVTAGSDVTNLYFTGQNLTTDSVTSIIAGGTIDQGVSIVADDQRPVITVGGPGTLLVQAGGNIELGNSGGINSVGNLKNSGFSGDGANTDSDVIVVAGAKTTASMAESDVSAFFATLATASDELSRLKAAGKDAEYALLLEKTEKSVANYFETYRDENKGTGNINLVDSSISSRSGSMYVMAAGNMDIGKTALSNAPKTSTGITTIYGGDLNVYAGNDINVNESRLMTFMGGDITVWSDQGDINAGRGSKTTVSAPTANYKFENGVLKSVSYTPPAIGSGIRAVTFDPDGESGPQKAPEAGKDHIYAKGIVDAGEAGIQGSQVLIAASAVLNAQNIVASAGMVGVPSTSQNTISIGPMTGTSDVTNDKKLIETIANSVAAKDKKSALSEGEDSVMKYLDVKTIDLSNEPI